MEMNSVEYENRVHRIKALDQPRQYLQKICNN